MLSELCCRKYATTFSKSDLTKLPLDLHDQIRKHLNKEQQIELWNGEYKKWYSNGQLWQHYFYKNGKLDGEQKCWYENGHLLEHSFYKNGEFDGEYKYWYLNGQLMVHCFYKNGEKIKDLLP